MLVVGDKFNRIIFDLRIFLACTLVTTLWCSLSAMTVERLIALTMPFRYEKYVTKTVLNIVIPAIWILNVMIPIIILTVSTVKVCGHYDDSLSCDIFDIMRPLRQGLTVCLCIYAILIIATYAKILCICHRKQLSIDYTSNQIYMSEIAKRKKPLTATRTVTVIVLIFLLTHLPVFIHLVVVDHAPVFQNHLWRIIFQCMDYAGHQINSYATLYIYIWKIKECRMHLYIHLSRFNKTLLEYAYALKIEVYNIVLNEKSYTKKASSPNT